MDTEKITVETRIKAQPQKIWRLWTQPDHITEWNFAKDDWHCVKAENDLRVGGKFCYQMEAKDKSSGFDFEGVYTEVIDHEEISYTLPDGRDAITTFENLGNHTKMTTTFDAEQESSIDTQKECWQAMINNFQSYVEAN